MPAQEEFDRYFLEILSYQTIVYFHHGFQTIDVDIEDGNWLFYYHIGHNKIRISSHLENLLFNKFHISYGESNVLLKNIMINFFGLPSSVSIK